jgi:hypothetical protein
MFYQNAFVFAPSLIIVSEFFIIKNRDNIVRQMKYNEIKNCSITKIIILLNNRNDMIIRNRIGITYSLYRIFSI